MMQQQPTEAMQEAADHMEGSGDEQAAQDENDYYSDFARRVYFLADLERWPREKTLRYFNDRQGFEKYYTNWQKKQYGIEDKIPTCVKRLMVDSQSRAEQKIRDEQAKIERDRHEEERVIQESKMIARERRQNNGGQQRKFSKFMEDQITFQMRRQDNLKRVMFEESAKAPLAPKISEKSRIMIERKAIQEQPELAAPVHKRLYYAQPKQKVAREPKQSMIEGGAGKQRPQTAHPTYHPQISKGSEQILQRKRQGDVVDSLYEDANRRQVHGKKIRAPKKIEEAQNESQMISPRKNDKDSSTGLLMKRFEKDLYEVLRQFEIDEDTPIAEVTMTEIMVHMGFVQPSSNAELEAVQSIWQHLQPIGGQSKEEGDNGERVVVAHLRVFMAAILGFPTGKPAKVANPDPSLIGTIDEQTSDYMLSAFEVTKVHKRYKQLSANRTDHVLMQRLERQQERLASQNGQNDQNMGKPNINSKSQKIFEQMKEKKKIDIGENYGDYLMSRGRQYEQKRQDEQAKKDMEDPENNECTFQPSVYGSTRKGDKPGNDTASKIGNSANKWEELYHQAERKQGKLDRNQDQIEFEKNIHEMKFAPEIHAVNLRGTNKPIVTKGSKQAMRERLQGKLDYLNAGNYGTLVDAQNNEIGNLQIGAGFEDQEGYQMRSARSNRRMAEGEAECLDMEIVIGEQPYVITIFQDSDPDALAQEFAAQHSLPEELIDQLRQQIQANLDANFTTAANEE